MSEPAASPALPASLSTPPAESAVTDLADWNAAIERALLAGDAERAVAGARIVLARLPRQLTTYAGLLRALWVLKRWEEGEEWGRRLLGADPNSAAAWRSVARAVEGRGRRLEAHALWRRAFEASPYDLEIRAGLVRTSLSPDPLALNAACLATLYLRGYRWKQAAGAYAALVQRDPRRIDFQVSLMVALWQSGENDRAYALARQLTQSSRHLLLAWEVLRTLGDSDDAALAEHPIASMDPDGSYVRSWLALDRAPRSEGGTMAVTYLPARPVPLHVTAEDAAFLPV